MFVCVSAPQTSIQTNMLFSPSVLFYLSFLSALAPPTKNKFDSTFLFRFSFYSRSSTLLFRKYVAASLCGLEPLLYAALQLLCFPASPDKDVAVPQKYVATSTFAFPLLLVLCSAVC
jgi:hypothetical protein